MRINTNINSM
nr:RecName: Full=Flagellin [Bacillus cereus]